MEFNDDLTSAHVWMLRACNIPEERRSHTLAKPLVPHLNDLLLNIFINIIVFQWYADIP